MGISSRAFHSSLVVERVLPNRHKRRVVMDASRPLPNGQNRGVRGFGSGKRGAGAGEHFELQRQKQGKKKPGLRRVFDVDRRRRLSHHWTM
jgi:hypothetical protein